MAYRLSQPEEENFRDVLPRLARKAANLINMLPEAKRSKTPAQSMAAREKRKDKLSEYSKKERDIFRAEAKREGRPCRAKPKREGRP